MNRRQRNQPPINWDEIREEMMDSHFRVQLELVSMDNYSMIHRDSSDTIDDKMETLTDLLNYFIKVEEYEICSELKKQIDKLWKKK
jgi:hypothetical protein